MASAPHRAPEWATRAAVSVDESLPAMELPADLLREVFQHAHECYPEEACGLLVGPAGSAPRRIERCTNVQRRRKLAGESELDAHDGYWIDERELLEALRRADQQGEVLRVIYHSHVDTGAYFSHADQAAALGPHDTPLWPGVAQLVVSVYESGVRDAAYFDWDETRQSFRGRSVARSD